MRHVRILAVVACLAANLVIADDEGWMEDFEAAKAKASAEGKDLLIDFTGSDWCGWCIKLKSEVFDQEAFKTAAPKIFVLVELDYPQQKPQSDAIKAQNQKLQGEFGIEGFPTIYLTDAQGRPYARTGYQAGGPEKYLEHLAELQKTRAERDELFAKAEKAEGVDKARALDEVLAFMASKEVSVKAYQGVIDEIMTLDAENKAGLKSKYEASKALAEIESTLMGGNFDEAITKIDAFVGTEGLAGEQKQRALFLKAVAFHNKGDKAATVEALKAALDAAPDGEKAEEIRQAIQQLGG